MALISSYAKLEGGREDGGRDNEGMNRGVEAWRRRRRRAGGRFGAMFIVWVCVGTSPISLRVKGRHWEPSPRFRTQTERGGEVCARLCFLVQRWRKSIHSCCHTVVSVYRLSVFTLSCTQKEVWECGAVGKEDKGYQDQ